MTNFNSADLEFSQIEDDVQPQPAQLDPLRPVAKALHKNPALGLDICLDSTGRSRTL